MSATTITKLSRKAQNAFRPFVPLIQEGIGSLRAAREQVASATLALAYVTLDASAALLAAGATGEQAQDAILKALGEDENGERYAWKTIERWHTAANVDKTLGESERGRFGVDALVALRGVKDLDERVAAAEYLAAEGLTAVRPVRAHVSAMKESSASKAPAGMTGVDKLVAKLRKVATDSLAAHEVEWSPEIQDLVYTAAIIGVRVGRDGKAPTKAQQMAAETLVYFGAVEDSDESGDETDG